MSFFCIKEEISQPLGGSEALGNSEDSSVLSAADKEKMFAPYEQYGMTYDAVKDELTYNGNLVRWFEDYYPISNNETAGIDFLNENGTVDVYAVRDLENFSKAADGSVDPAGKLIGLKEFTQQEFDARDIEALKNSTSVAMAGTPLEDSVYVPCTSLQEVYPAYIPPTSLQRLKLGIWLPIIEEGTNCLYFWCFVSKMLIL